uniref:G-protein coupled receptors family 1 profile domain-containing protein n=1 Tax=Pyxicephalus adspersus TaxID=30357 RepID=A0AAV3APS5_PYXAD|nr:TPA: hypothetical protein GDO54_005903 [Pyxicephalus adspersus]
MALDRYHTLVTEYLLLAFRELHEFKILLFTFFLTIHIMTITSNVLVVVLVAFFRSLHSPMYFFLSQLSLSEILFTINIVPNMLRLILEGGGKISVARCIFQLYLLAVPAVAQCLLLASMSFDRYLAICKPLQYATIMTFTKQVEIATTCWLGGFMVSFVLYGSIDSLNFCGPNIINHFYCDISPVVQRSCSENTPILLLASVLCFPFIVCPFMLIVVTYIFILNTILNIPSTSGRQKAFSTCSSHLTIVSLYYGSIGSKYIVPTSKSSGNLDKVLSLPFILMTPLINPLIYTLRNHEFRRVISKSILLLSNLYCVKTTKLFGFHIIKRFQ